MSVVKVTQEDRDASAAAGHGYAMKVLSGKGGGHEVLAQAFARHRQSAIAELCEGLRSLAGNAGALGAFEDEIRAAAGNTNWQCLRDAIARADALLSKHSPDAPGDAGTRAIEPSDGDEA